jgi:hypothetical protein
MQLIWNGHAKSVEREYVSRPVRAFASSLAGWLGSCNSHQTTGAKTHP